MIAVEKSLNAKTGPCAVTYRGMDTCPSGCPMKAGCYGKAGPIGIVFRRATEEKTDDVEVLANMMMTLPQNYNIRHHVTGDFVGADQEIDLTYLNSVLNLHRLRPDLRGWAYTHAWKKFEKNPSIPGININASCDSISDIKEAKKMGFNTVIVMPENAPVLTKTEGEKIIICPAQTNKNVTCEKCMLCARENRDITVGFRVHGALKKRYNFT